MTLVHPYSYLTLARRLMVITTASLLALGTIGICPLEFESDTLYAQTAAVPQSNEPEGNADVTDSAEESAEETVSDVESANDESDANDRAEGETESSESEQETAAGSTSGFLSTLLGLLQTPPIGYLFQGGLFMWPILIMGIVAAGVIIERYRSLNMLAGDSNQLRTDVQALLEADRVRDAFELCNQQQGPVPAILATGLRKYLVLQTLDYEPAKIEEQVVKSMDDYSVHIVAALERHLPILATISSAAPMLGFLGTVQGMIVAFDDIVAKMGETNIVEAAAVGIKVSLMTTCFGLIVGIPAFVAFNYFTGIINRFVLDVEESASEMIETVTLQTAISTADTDPGGSSIQ